MNNYDLKQVDDLTFKCDISYINPEIADIFEAWLTDNFKEDDDFYIACGSYGTHAYTIYIIFKNESAAIAFKLRWG